MFHAPMFHPPIFHPTAPSPSATLSIRSVARSALLGLAVLLLGPGLAAADITRSFDTGPGGRLDVRVEGASVEVDTVDDGVVTVSVERRRGDEPIEEDFQVDLSQTGDSVLVDIEKKTRQWFRGDSLKVEVTVPRRYDVDIETSGGSVAVADLEGDVRTTTSGGSVSLGAIDGTAFVRTSGGSIQLASSTVTADLATSGGSIQIGDVGGEVSARTSGGSVQVARADGDIVVETSGGSITLGEIGGSIRASTSGGGVTASFTRQPTDDSRISTSGGSIRVGLAPGLGFDLDARGSSGVTTRVPLEIRGKIDRNRVQGKLNGGGPALELRASGGGVTIDEL